MKRKHLWLALILALTCGTAHSAVVQRVTQIATRPTGVNAKCVLSDGQQATLLLRFYSPSTVRLALSVGDSLLPPPTLLEEVKPVPVRYEVLQKARSWEIVGEEFSIRILKDPCSLVFLNRAGKPILRMRPEDGLVVDQDGVEVRFVLEKGDHFYGFGEKFGPLDKRGTTVEIWNRDAGDSYGDSTYINIPLCLNPRGFGLFFHTTWRTVWDLRASSPSSYSVRADGGALDVFFIYGPSLKKVLADYTYLTGRMELPPRWALGLWHGTYTGGFKGKAGLGQEEFLRIARGFRKRRIPCDVLRIDSNWDDLEGSDYLWHKSYPEPVKMIEQVKAMGYKMSLHDRPIPYGVLRKYPLRMGWLVPPDLEYLDFTIPEAARWWWRRHEVLVDMGVDAFKPDIGEEIPLEARFANGKSGAEMHNLYAKLYVQTSFEGLKAYTGKRAVVWARSGYVGSQKYPLIWAGDQHYSRWDCLPTLIRAGQSVGLSGYPLWSHDIGGIGTQHGIIPPADVYIRWAQFGFFSGVPQTFGRPWREPWKYDPEAYHGLDVEKIFRRYDELRYRLIPYIYSLVWEAHRTGLPLMRAMVLEFQSDPAAWKHDLQYMFGPALLVAPIYDETGRRTVYLPKGTWFDYWTGHKLRGGKEIRVQVAPETLPVYVRAGSIVPMGPVMQYVGERPVEPLVLDVYPGNGPEFVYYEDDGETYEYERGQYRELPLRCEESGGMLRLKIGPARGELKDSETKTLIAEIHTSQPSSVRVGGESLACCQDPDELSRKERGWCYLRERGVVRVQLPYRGSWKGLTIEVIR